MMWLVSGVDQGKNSQPSQYVQIPNTNHALYQSTSPGID